MRIGVPSSDATAARRDESRLRELDRKALRAVQLAQGGPRGIVAQARKTSGPVTTSATTSAGAASVIDVSAQLLFDRLYAVYAPNLGFFGTAGQLVVVQILYTMDGSAPSATSTQLVQTTCDTSGTTRGAHPFETISITRDASDDLDATGRTFRALVTMFGTAAGSYTCVAQPGWPQSQEISVVSFASLHDVLQ